MEKVQCINQHWFDSEKYMQCPFCGAAKMAVKVETAAIGKTESERKTIGQILFSRRKTGTTEIATGSMIPPTGQIGPTVRPSNIPVTQGTSDIPKTELLIKPKNGQTEIVPQDPYGNVTSYLFSEEVKTPVTAWLVGISGKHSGRSYVVKPGVNLLVNTFDRGATITYEPVTRRFMIDGDASEIYCNGFRVGSKRELGAYDVIEIENDKYMFVPFCGPNFDWNNTK